MIIPPLVQAGLDKISDKIQRFDHRQVRRHHLSNWFTHRTLQSFTVEISEDFLDFIEEGTLAVEVWGHRRSGFPDLALAMAGEEGEQRRPKSFPERWDYYSACVCMCVCICVCVCA